MEESMQAKEQCELASVRVLHIILLFKLYYMEQDSQNLKQPSCGNKRSRRKGRYYKYKKSMSCHENAGSRQGESRMGEYGTTISEDILGKRPIFSRLSVPQRQRRDQFLPLHNYEEGKRECNNSEGSWRQNSHRGRQGNRGRTRGKINQSFSQGRFESAKSSTCDDEPTRWKREKRIPSDRQNIPNVQARVAPRDAKFAASFLPMPNPRDTEGQASKRHCSTQITISKLDEIVDMMVPRMSTGVVRNVVPQVTPQLGGLWCYVRLFKERKIICRAQCTGPPFQLPSSLNIVIDKKERVEGLAGLPHFLLYPAYEDDRQKMEWGRFLNYLYGNNKVAVADLEGFEIHIFPPEGTKSCHTNGGLNFSHAIVAYKVKEAHATSVVFKNVVPVSDETDIKTEHLVSVNVRAHARETQDLLQPMRVLGESGMKDILAKGSSSSNEKGASTSMSRGPQAVDGLNPSAAIKDSFPRKNFTRADPSYLKTLGQAHSSWIFGAIAELVDNSRDAKASRLDISIENIYHRKAGCEIPMLSLVDDGHGMNHQEILKMISFGHKQPDEDDPYRIGRFGVGFKTGAMRLGKDALVLTQTAESRSFAFLSQSLNEGKDDLEIPIVSYRRQGQYIELDTGVQPEAQAKHNMRAIKEFSPFDKFLIGEKAALFSNNTGTQIYIWNLDKWGSDYSLEWQTGMRGKSSFYQGDICIRSRWVRSRPGQISRQVPLDYSLRSYLEVIFLDPRMKIYVQGSLVKSRPLAKSLSKTVAFDGDFMGKTVQLTLGRCQLEWEQANCGIFLYWHGRLIEAYKRVGGMIHCADMGRGVIGVIDVTGLMDDGNGSVWVLSNKQGFQDCESYAKLEAWLGDCAEKYWDEHFDALQLERGNALYKPDHEWVQCDKCRKWRILNSGFDSKTLPPEWFCYMPPFSGRCDIPEEKADRGVITVGAKRSRYDLGQDGHAECREVEFVDGSIGAEGESEEDSSQMVKDDAAKTPISKSVKRGTVRAGAKKK